MENIILRNIPHFEISIGPETFVLKIENDPRASGSHEFSEIESLRMERRVNWPVSVMSYVLGIISGATAGGTYRDSDLLQFNYKKRQKKISLKGSDLNLAVETIDKINRKIAASKKNYSSQDL